MQILNEWCIYIALFCVLLYTPKRFTYQALYTTSVYNIHVQNRATYSSWTWSNMLLYPTLQQRPMQPEKLKSGKYWFMSGLPV